MFTYNCIETGGSDNFGAILVLVTIVVSQHGKHEVGEQFSKNRERVRQALEVTPKVEAT